MRNDEGKIEDINTKLYDMVKTNPPPALPRIDTSTYESES